MSSVALLRPGIDKDSLCINLIKERFPKHFGRSTPAVQRSTTVALADKVFQGSSADFHLCADCQNTRFSPPLSRDPDRLDDLFKNLAQPAFRKNQRPEAERMIRYANGTRQPSRAAFKEASNLRPVCARGAPSFFPRTSPARTPAHTARLPHEDPPTSPCPSGFRPRQFFFAFTESTFSRQKLPGTPRRPDVHVGLLSAPFGRFIYPIL